MMVNWYFKAVVAWGRKGTSLCKYKCLKKQSIGQKLITVGNKARPKTFLLLNMEDLNLGLGKVDCNALHKLFPS